MIVSLVVAASANEVIGDGGALPWHIPGDLRRFRTLTTGHVVVMGRLTYQSILDRLGHPLTGRTSIVVSRTLADPGHPEVLVARSIPEALALAGRLAAEAGDSEFFVIGGESVYRDTLPLADRVYLTRVHGHEPDDGDPAIGIVDTPAIAALIVAAVNAYIEQDPQRARALAEYAGPVPGPAGIPAGGPQ